MHIVKKVWSFVVTGGPCSGKTTALSTIEQELSSRGYYVLTIPETATELIPNGIRPFGDSLSILDFQYVVFSKQLFKEELYHKVAKIIPHDKIVIIFDRGLMDNKSYITENEFAKILSDFGMTETQVQDRYDAVFHLVTAANGAEDYYTLDNNMARTETAEEARRLDKLGIANWTGHNHLRIIDNSTDFQKKIRRLMNQVYFSLGEPTPLEIERKYLIEKPSIEDLASHADITVVDIFQTYLESANPFIERRIRARGQNGSYSYFLSEKDTTFGLSRVKLEKKISEEEYGRFLGERNLQITPISKERVCFVYKGQYFEIDIFNFMYPDLRGKPSCNKALLEIELTSANDTVTLPDFIKVIKEVTDDPYYRNYNLAVTQSL